MPALAAPQPRGVAPLYLVGTGREHGRQPRHALHQKPGCCGRIILLPCELTHAHRIGGIAPPHALIYIKPYSGYGAAYASALESAFDQYARYLLLADVDVVGPLHFGLNPCQLGDHTGRGYRHSFRHHELLAGLRVRQSGAAP